MSEYTIKEPGAPASEKQISYLKSLVAKKECPAVTGQVTLLMETSALTKGAASKYIDTLSSAPFKKVAPATVTMVPVEPTPVPDVEHGYYKTAEGSFYVLVMEKGKYGNDILMFRKLVFPPSWAPHKKAKWLKMGYGNYAQTKANYTVTGLSPLSLEQVAAEGKLHGICIRCGAHLTDPVSVADGIGPVCRKYWSDWQVFGN